MLAELGYDVSYEDTAIALGTGSVPVLATPRLVAWLEAASLVAAAPRLHDGETTVGTRVEVLHRRPSVVGAHVVVQVLDLDTSGWPRLEFKVRAECDGVLVAEGTVRRHVVDAEEFVARLR